jgi:hypothetical protein
MASNKEQVNVRLRPGLRNRIQGKMLASPGSSQNAVINQLIEDGLNAEKPMQLAFGSQAAFHVMRACATAAEAVAARQGADNGLWLWDPENFDLAAAAIMRTLETIRPGSAVPEALAKVEEARQHHAQQGASHG